MEFKVETLGENHGAAGETACWWVNITMREQMETNINIMFHFIVIDRVTSWEQYTVSFKFKTYSYLMCYSVRMFTRKQVSL